MNQKFARLLLFVAGASLALGGCGSTLPWVIGSIVVSRAIQGANGG